MDGHALLTGWFLNGDGLTSAAQDSVRTSVWALERCSMSIVAKVDVLARLLVGRNVLRMVADVTGCGCSDIGHPLFELFDEPDWVDFGIVGLRNQIGRQGERLTIDHFGWAGLDVLLVCGAEPEEQEWKMLGPVAVGFETT